MLFPEPGGPTTTWPNPPMAARRGRLGDGTAAAATASGRLPLPVTAASPWLDSATCDGSTSVRRNFRDCTLWRCSAFSFLSARRLEAPRPRLTGKGLAHSALREPFSLAWTNLAVTTISHTLSPDRAASDPRKRLARLAKRGRVRDFSSSTRIHIFSVFELVCGVYNNLLGRVESQGPDPRPAETRRPGLFDEPFAQASTRLLASPTRTWSDPPAPPTDRARSAAGEAMFDRIDDDVDDPNRSRCLIFPTSLWRLTMPLFACCFSERREDRPDAWRRARSISDSPPGPSTDGGRLGHPPSSSGRTYPAPRPEEPPSRCDRDRAGEWPAPLRPLNDPPASREMLWSASVDVDAQQARMRELLALDTKLADDLEVLCPTCLDRYDGDNPALVARCGHAFHLPCIYEWLERGHATCPVCGAPMVFEELKPDAARTTASVATSAAPSRAPSRVASPAPRPASRGPASSASPFGPASPPTVEVFGSSCEAAGGA